MKYQTENFGGIYDFRCRFHDQWFVELHIHEYSELLYCQEGTCEVCVNGKRILLSEKQLVWLPPNYIHQYKCTEGKVICAVFSNDFIPLFFRVSKERRMIVKAIDVSNFTDMLDTLPLVNHDNLLMITAFLNLICSRVIEKSEFENTSPSDGILYQKVISYLSEHFREDISLKQVAKEFNYNEKYLSHALHTLTGMHFSHLLAVYRIEYAKNLLIKEPPATVSEIAFISGFSAMNTFNRVFKKITGVTPTQYRRIYFQGMEKEQGKL